MKIVLAPQLDVSVAPSPPIAWEELVRHGVLDVPTDTEDSVHDVVHRLISEDRPDLVGAEPQVDAPPFSADLWWLATVRRKGEMAVVVPFPLGDGFGIDKQGRVHFAYPGELPVRDLASALSEGHYEGDQDYLVVTRAGEFGGNGFQIESLVLWLLQEFPLILLGVGVDRIMLRHDSKQRKDLEALAADWARRHILYPVTLKRFVESRQAWYPSVLAERLGLSEDAARRLLDAVGYEPSRHDYELFEFSHSPAAQASRQRWEDAQWEATFTSLEDLLGADQQRPDDPYAVEAGQEQARPPLWARLRAWIVRRLPHRS